MAERLVQDPTVGGSSFYSANDELEPLDMIQINLEASLLALAGKLQVGWHFKILNSECYKALYNYLESSGSACQNL